MWKNIIDNNDLMKFMNEMHGFHDSCIKELKYLSGAYVDSEMSMHPLNDRKVLKIIIQRQFEKNSMIEMEFSGLKYLKLFPVDDAYTCEILDSTMIFNNECIYWCDSGDLSEVDLESYQETVICASKLRWRSIDGFMDSNEFYTSAV